MRSNLPSLSIIIPTYNSEKVLGLCLEKIREQNYPREKIEVIIIDGASTDRTLDIAKQFKADKILKNPLKTGEAGKSIGIDASENEIIVSIDSDNVLEGNDWLKKMVKPFEDLKIVSSEVSYWTYRKEDSIINRYCALMGVNDPLCFFLGNYDRYSTLSGRWTDLIVKEKDKGDYLEVELNKHNVPTMGANGYLVRKKIIKKTNYKPYLFDIDAVYQLVTLGHNQIARVKIGIIHLFANNVRQFTMKTRRRIKDYLFYKKNKLRMYPWREISKLKLLKFVVYTLLIIPLVCQALMGYIKKPDRAWFFHIPACWITLIVYTSATIQNLFKVVSEDRSKWKE